MCSYTTHCSLARICGYAMKCTASNGGARLDSVKSTPESHGIESKPLKKIDCKQVKPFMLIKFERRLAD